MSSLRRVPLGLTLVFVSGLSHSVFASDLDADELILRMDANSAEVREAATAELKALSVDEIRAFYQQVKDQLFSEEIGPEPRYRIASAVCERVVSGDLPFDVMAEMLNFDNVFIAGVAGKYVRENTKELELAMLNYLESAGVEVFDTEFDRHIAIGSAWLADNASKKILAHVGPYRSLYVDAKEIGAANILAELPELGGETVETHPDICYIPGNQFDFVVDGGVIGDAEIESLDKALARIRENSVLTLKFYYPEVQNYEGLKQVLTKHMSRFTSLSLQFYGWEDDPEGVAKELKENLVCYSSLLISRGGYLGVNGSYGYTEEDRAKIRVVVAEAGYSLREGDQIMAVNGTPIGEHLNIRSYVANYDIGDVVSMEVLRQGERINVDVELQRATYRPYLTTF